MEALLLFQSVDTTLCPSAYLMRLCTTLVKFNGWHMFEYCKPLYDLQTYTEKMRVGSSFQGVLTLAHTRAIPPEQLGFDVGADSITCVRLNLAGGLRMRMRKKPLRSKYP